MFNFFLNLFFAVFNGEWYSWNRINVNGVMYTLGNTINNVVNSTFSWLGNCFNNSTSNSFNFPTLTLGLYNFSNQTFTSVHDISSLEFIVCIILSTICCISVFFIIVKAIKKLFTCFLDF